MAKDNKNLTSFSWLNAADIEGRLKKVDTTQTIKLTEAIARVREGVAEQIVRHRNEEAADFADAQHQIVGYEIR